jgi:hypothetical protein
MHFDDDDLSPVTIPPLTLGMCKVLLYHLVEGARTKGHWVQFPACVTAMQSPEWGAFACYDDVTKLRDQFNPPLLRFPKGKPLSNEHRLPLSIFHDPENLIRAINEAENRHNQSIQDAINANRDAEAKEDAHRARNPDAPPIRIPRVPENKKPVPLTTMPDLSGMYMGYQAPAAPQTKLAIGDIVQTPEGPAVIVAGPDGAPAIKPLAVVKATKSKGGDSGREDRESSSPPKDGPGDDSTPPRPPAPTTPTPSGKATPISAGGGRVRGHEAA